MESRILPGTLAILLTSALAFTTAPRVLPDLTTLVTPATCDQGETGPSIDPNGLTPRGETGPSIDPNG